VLGVEAQPAHVSTVRWPQAIAQYTLGHHARLERIRGLAEAHAGLHLCGTSYDGVSFNHAVKSGRTMARALAGRLLNAAAAPVDEASREAVAV
jgi:oxygen-dependent protoporphyrinogen oxidase